MKNFNHTTNSTGTSSRSLKFFFAFAVTAIAFATWKFAGTWSASEDVTTGWIESTDVYPEMAWSGETWGRTTDWNEYQGATWSGSPWATAMGDKSDTWVSEWTCPQGTDGWLGCHWASPQTTPTWSTTQV